MPRGPILLTLFLKKYFYLFIFGCIGSLLLSRLFSSWVEQGPLSRCGAWAPHCRGLSGCRARVSVVTAWRLSSCDAQALEHRLNSYGAQTLLVSGMWDLPASGIEPRIPYHWATREAPLPITLTHTHALTDLCMLLSHLGAPRNPETLPLPLAQNPVGELLCQVKALPRSSLIFPVKSQWMLARTLCSSQTAHSPSMEMSGTFLP